MKEKTTELNTKKSNILSRKRKTINKNDNIINKKNCYNTFYDNKLHQEVIEINGNSSCHNVELFDINKFIPLKERTDEDNELYYAEEIKHGFVQNYDDYFYEQLKISSNVDIDVNKIVEK
jgi:hypothetical protein